MYTKHTCMHNVLYLEDNNGKFTQKLIIIHVVYMYCVHVGQNTKIFWVCVFSLYNYINK